MRLAAALVATLALLPAGCAAPPAVDADIARADAHTDRAGASALLREQTERIAHAHFVAGNRVTLLLDGPETLAALSDAIGHATRRIDMESYTFDAAEGTRFADLLLARRAAGVDVNLIYDAWGSNATPPALFDRLRAGGVRVLQYNPLGPNPRVPVDLNRRDHRKLLVVDGAATITGGVNISRVYVTRAAPTGAGVPDQLPWRDTDVRIDGPVSGMFDAEFMKTWQAQHGPPIPSPPAPPGFRQGDAAVLAIDGSPDSERPLIYRTLVVAITLARRSVHLTTGYFAPTPDLRHVLERAARRGVDVRIVVPAHSDSSLSIAAGRGAYEDLLEAGVRIYERQGVVLHAKTAVIDGDYSIVGSSNLDWRSVLFNNEIDAVVIDAAFGRQMEDLFATDEAASQAIDLAAWRRRPIGERLREWTARLFAPLL